ncbi:MAG: sucrase ferredoxin, partial [Nocardioidaceae bacterium]|nr:sucrase ferredoxin [Nocardioidaceae bacterium]
VFAAYAHPSAPWLETTTIGSEDALLDLDLEALGRGESPGLTPTDEPVFLVCTHGRHDTCCAELGRPAAAALAASHPEHAWEVSHIGGDRFAANLLVLPHGLYYGRVGDLDAPLLAARHLDGHLDLDRLRGRSGYPFPVQVAEVAVRRAAGETRDAAVRLLWQRREDDEWHASFDVSGSTYAARVRRGTGAREQLTCRAVRDNPVPTYEVVEVRSASSGAPASAPPSPASPRG